MVYILFQCSFFEQVIIMNKGETVISKMLKKEELNTKDKMIDYAEYFTLPWNSGSPATLHKHNGDVINGFIELNEGYEWWFFNDVQGECSVEVVDRYRFMIGNINNKKLAHPIGVGVYDDCNNVYDLNIIVGSEVEAIKKIEILRKKWTTNEKH